MTWISREAWIQAIWHCAVAFLTVRHSGLDGLVPDLMPMLPLVSSNSEAFKVAASDGTNGMRGGQTLEALTSRGMDSWQDLASIRDAYWL